MLFQQNASVIVCFYFSAVIEVKAEVVLTQTVAKSIGPAQERMMLKVSLYEAQIVDYLLKKFLEIF